MDCVFLVIPNLIRNCILGIIFLKDERCLIDVEKGVVEFRRREEEQNVSVPIVHMEVVEEEEEDEIEKKINAKVDNITGVDEKTLENLREVLMNNKSLFRDSPGSCLLYTSRCV